MPSKGGRGTGTRPATAVVPAVSAPPVLRSREEWDAVGFRAAEITQALRRGVDVERFNELARRQDLTDEEADELYRLRLRRVQSRLRQLDRARGGGYEEAIRTALDDLDARLDELRATEAARSAAGLATGYELDLSPRQAAIDHLLEQARRRPMGLVAGSDIPPEQPTGTVRLPEIAFQARPDDVPVYIVAPRSLPSQSLTGNVEAVARQGAQLYVVNDASEVPRGGDTPPLVINWGGNESLPAGLVALNQPEAVRIASDQVESVRRLGELAPRTVLRPDDLALLGTDRVVAKQRQGARGTGKTVIPVDAPWGDRARYDLFQELVADRDEYRLSILSGRIVSAYQKRAPEGTSPENLRPEWSHELVHDLPASVAAVAREGARRIGLDYAGVDVVVDRSTGRAYCIEANAAPGMSEQTLRSLYAQIQQTVRQRLARAS